MHLTSNQILQFSFHYFRNTAVQSRPCVFLWVSISWLMFIGKGHILIFIGNRLYVFRHHSPMTTDCLYQCIQHVTRLTNDHHTECVSGSVQDQTTQAVDYCSSPSVTGTVPSMSDCSDINCCQSTDVHNGLHVVQNSVDTGTTLGQPDCGDECTSITLIAYCLAQYISTLDTEHRNHVQSLLFSDTVDWISKVFR